MKHRTENVNRNAVDELSGNRVRIVLPSVGVREASLAGLEEQIRTASRVESQARARRLEAASELRRRRGQARAEATVRRESGHSARGSRVEVETAEKLKDLPDTRKAFGEGEITFGHAKIIANTADRTQIDEQLLVKKARVQPVDVFARTARKHEQERSEDDGMSRLEAQKRMRRAGIKIDQDDGMTVLWARFDPVTGARIRNVLSAKSSALWRAEDHKHRPSPEQRMADALAELLTQPSTSVKNSKKPKGPKSTLLLIANYDIDQQVIRDATTENGTPVPVEVFQEVACQEGKVVPAIFNTRGQPLWVGMDQRLATRAQRLALIARDRGCVGCRVDPAWCQAHHVVPWQADGPTDIDNLVLLCSRCHHRVHDEGWQIQQSPGGEYVMVQPARNNRARLPIRTPARRRRKRTVRLQR